jgi:hypothetical protein
MPSGTRGPNNIVITPTSVVGVDHSPYTLKSQVQVYPGQMWKADVTLAPMRKDFAEQWVAFFLALNGQQGTFLLGDPNSLAPRGVATGTPVVTGTPASGQNQLPTGGWTPNVTNILKAGDWIQLGTTNPHLHKNLFNANSDSSGNVTLTLWPNLRIAPTAGDALTLTNTVGQFRLATNNMPYAIDTSQYYDISFSAVEAL